VISGAQKRCATHWRRAFHSPHGTTVAARTLRLEEHTRTPENKAPARQEIGPSSHGIGIWYENLCIRMVYKAMKRSGKIERITRRVSNRDIAPDSPPFCCVLVPGEVELGMHMVRTGARKSAFQRTFLRCLQPPSERLFQPN
jgi:hypothetical protein